MSKSSDFDPWSLPRMPLPGSKFTPFPAFFFPQPWNADVHQTPTGGSKTLIINTYKRIQVISYFVGKLAFVTSQMFESALIPGWTSHQHVSIFQRKNFKKGKLWPMQIYFPSQFSALCFNSIIKVTQIYLSSPHPTPTIHTPPHGPVSK